MRRVLGKENVRDGGFCSPGRGVQVRVEGVEGVARLSGRGAGRLSIDHRSVVVAFCADFI